MRSYALVYDDSRLCALVSNGDSPLKEGDDVKYKDVEIGEPSDTGLDEALNNAA